MGTITAGRNGTDDAGKLLLRATLAILLLFHGVAKIAGSIGFIAGMLAKAGMPAALGYLVYVFESLPPGGRLAGL